MSEALRVPRVYQLVDAVGGASPRSWPPARAYPARRDRRLEPGLGRVTSVSITVCGSTPCAVAIWPIDPPGGEAAAKGLAVDLDRVGDDLDRVPVARVSGF